MGTAEIEENWKPLSSCSARAVADEDMAEIHADDLAANIVRIERIELPLTTHSSETKLPLYINTFEILMNICWFEWFELQKWYDEEGHQWTCQKNGTEPFTKEIPSWYWI